MADYSVGRFPTRLVPRFFRREAVDVLTAPDGAPVVNLFGVPGAVNALTITNALSGSGPTISAEDTLNLVAPSVNVNGVDVANNQKRFITGTVTTAAATAAKTVTLDAPWASYTPVAGDMIVLTYTLGTNVNTATVSINGGSAIAVRTPGGSAASTWHYSESGSPIVYRYDGTYLRLMFSGNLADISDAGIINPASGGWGLITGVRAAYLKRKAITTAVTSSATPAISLDLGDWSTISVAHNVTAITTTGTGTNLQTVNLKLVGTGSYTLAFGSTWNFGFGVSEPASIASAKAIYIVGRWNSTTSKIDVIDVKAEA